MIPKSENRYSETIMRRQKELLMRRMQRIVLMAMLIAVVPVLAGCENFDMDKLDVFGLNDKKKLPGDRKPLFPEGVPGVSQGIPAEFVKGTQPTPDNVDAAPLPAEPAKKTAAVDPADGPKPKAKRKKPRAAAVPPAQSQSGTQAQPQSWPTQDQQQPPQRSSSAPWPSSPAPGTFSR